MGRWLHSRRGGTRSWQPRSPRLRLDLITQADVDELHHILDDPALHRFIGGRPLEVDELRERVRTWELLRSPDGQAVWLNWIVRLATTGVVIGYVQASVRDGIASIAYVIGAAYAGQGLATEATVAMCRALRERLGVRQLVAHIHPLHQASQRVAQHVGLKPTGDADAEGEAIWQLRLADATPDGS
jgi:RimJ/RimL family protein N-acetyltransferase